MSIASEITRLQGVKSNILSAIADKGVTVPVGSALADCPELIASISGGGLSESVPVSIYNNDNNIGKYENNIINASADYFGIDVGGVYNVSNVNELVFKTRLKADVKLISSEAYLFSRMINTDNFFSVNYFSGSSRAYWSFWIMDKNGNLFTNSDLELSDNNNRNRFNDSFHKFEVSFNKTTNIYKLIIDDSYSVQSSQYENVSYPNTVGIGIGKVRSGRCYLANGAQVDLSATSLIADGQYLFGSE